MAQQMLNVEVAYANATEQWVVPVSLPLSATVSDAIHASKILEHCPDIDLQKNKVGIFSVMVDLDHRLTDGDRIEIYRALPKDPITRRFERVTKQRGK
jgi:uncharacterized protein